MKYIISLSLIFLFSCAVYKTRRTFSNSDLSIKGGIYEDKEWNSKLTFKRYSWYKDATLTNEILLAKLDEKSDFAHWMDKDRLHLSTCEQFYIGLFYSDVNAEQKTPFLKSEVQAAGHDLKTMLGFTKELKAHQNLRDWHLTRHKVYGVCLSKDTTSIKVTLPGFGSKQLEL